MQQHQQTRSIFRGAAAAGLAVVVTAGLALTPAVQAQARKGSSFLADVAGALTGPSTTTVAAVGQIEVAFSPDEGAEELVVKVIDSARSEIRMLSYSLTSAVVTGALVRAKKRGVDVRVVADEKNNVSDDRSGKARAALSTLANAGIDIRTISAYAIHHDKVIVVDRQHVELGSFNYSDAAAHRNSENVLVNWGNPQLAQVYLKHFERNYRQSVAFQTRY